MDFLQQLEIWAKADAMQGKLMVVGGILALVDAFLHQHLKPYIELLRVLNTP
tara:strand:- start:412 stop:567 length:156 start_codon:yes stop_codon:yes gene_type:complete